MLSLSKKKQNSCYTKVYNGPETMNSKLKHQIEREFHNHWATQINPNEIDYEASFQSATATENHFVLSLLGNLNQKRILDLGCGLGDAALYFASKGALVSAVDISSGMIKLIKKLAKKNQFQLKIKAEVMLAEKLKFPQNHFDFVYGNGLLHHVDLKKSLHQVHRVLKPAGKAIFIEPLANNFIINLYRKMASKVRTPTETPLPYHVLNDLSNLGFSHFSHREFHLFTLVIFLWFFLMERVHPNEQRYWKKLITEGDRVGGVFNILNRLDKLVLKKVPLLKKYCWNSVLVFEK
ncbi:methyltransferase domain-containing protein [Patescibacteria group bacterium]